METFGSVIPFAEPAWYTTLNSPYYTDKHRQLRTAVRAQYDRTIIPNAEAWERDGQVPNDVYEDQARKGYIAASIYPLPTDLLDEIQLPGAISPSQWDAWCDLIMADESARSGYLGVSWGLGGGNCIGCPPIAAFGTPAQKQKFLKPVIRGEKRICLGITEILAGSDVASIGTTAKKTADGKNYIINGAKKWITNGIWADWMTTACRTGPSGSGAAGISLIIVPLDSKGVTRRRIHNTGVHASGSTFVEIDEVVVPVENLLGKENCGFPLIMTNFLHERLMLCMQAIRMSRICIEDAYEYARTRQTFGKKLIEQPVIRAKFAEMGRIVEGNQAWLEQLVHHSTTVSKARGDADLAGLMALLKVSCSQGLERVNREALQILGGIGYQRGGRAGRVEQISRDLRVIAIGGGSEEIMSEQGLRMTERLAQKRAARASKM